MIVGLRQFTLLLWKNFTLKKRQWILLIMEFLFELLFAVILLLLRNSVSPTQMDALEYAQESIHTLPSYFLNTKIQKNWELVYIPSNNEAVKNLAGVVQQTFNKRIKIRGFASEKDFEEYIKNSKDADRVMAAVVFDQDFVHSKGPLPLKIRYHLRFSYLLRNTSQPTRLLLMPNKDHGWHTSHLFPVYLLHGPRNPLENDGGTPGYVREGFLAIQHALDKAIIRYHAKEKAADLLRSTIVYTKRFPFPAFLEDNFFIYLHQIWPPMIVLIFSLTVITILHTIVGEKETKLKEYLLIMGLRRWQLWGAAFVTFFLTLSVTISLMTLFLFVEIAKLPIIRYSDPSLVFSFLLLYGMATILFAFMLSTFFSKASTAITIGSLIYFVSYLPYFVIGPHYNQMSLSAKLISCLLSNVAMAIGIDLLIKFESTEDGIHWENLSKPFSVYDNFAFGHIIAMLLIDTFLYIIVIWYVDAVLPRKYGMPQSWFFFVKPDYQDKNLQSNFAEQEKKEIINKNKDECFEPEPEHLVASVQIKNLTKVFKVGNTVKEAVKDLTLNLYEGQITALLGHNGSGKTTTLSMLTGLFPPTSGKAYICGFEITEKMSHIRKSLGLCPQHDLLFDYLTVFEHLYFFSRMKELHPDVYTEEINNILNVFKLRDKQHLFPNSLSRGMKRMLSISIALVGNSKVVVLDEPTSGMDLISRRATWELLKQQKNGRTILFTTNYMEEADLLGDRIAIMAKGDLQCCGSSLFLKKKYGAGYHVVMVKKPYCNAGEVARLVYHYVPTAILENNSGPELSFILPREYANRFGILFTELEQHGVRLGITSYCASITTMEEVFLKVSKSVDSEMDIAANQLPSTFDPEEIQLCQPTMDAKEKGDSLMPEDLCKVQFNTGVPLCIQQFHALLQKRALYTFRHWRIMLLQILMLLIFTNFLLKAILYYSELKDTPIMRISLQQYGQAVVPFSVSGERKLAGRFLKHLRIMLRNEDHSLQLVNGNIEDYLLETKQCSEQCIIAFSIEIYKGKTIITALFNNKAYHAAPIALTMIDNILFKSLSGHSASISVFNKPQPRTASQTIKEQFHEGSKGHDIAFSLFLTIALMVSNFSLLTVSERVCKAKHIQFVSGAYIGIFWLSAFFWDFIVFLVSSFLLLVVLYIGNVKVFFEDRHFIDALLILMLFGWSTIPFIYLMSFLFSSSTTAYTRLVVFNFLTGISSFFLVYIIDANVMNLGRFNKILVSIFFLLPFHNLGKSISGFYDNFRTQKYCTITSEDCKMNNIKYEENYYGFQGHGIGKYVVAMIVTGFLFFILLYIIEVNLWTYKSLCSNFLYGFLRGQKRAKVSEVSLVPEDQNVINEKNEVLECFSKKTPSLDRPVILKELVKIYFQCAPIVAVNGLTFAVQKGECFGLFGSNGAGKSSTLKMLTRDETITSGKVIIDGRNISTKMTEICQRISYCPPRNPLLEYLTGYEMLALHAHLWGVPKQYIPAYVKNILKALLLDAFADELIKYYSYSTKRKLSMAIALLGRPDIIFLDKPAAGMDPLARHCLWQTISRTRESGKTIVLISHSVQECESLCSRLAIMVNGKFTCLGSPQDLKNKYGNGYSLLAKVKMSKQAEMQELKTFFETTFPDSSLIHEHEGMVHYHITSKDFTWAKVFGILESIKDEYGLEDYSVSQITLEHVFLRFAQR